MKWTLKEFFPTFQGPEYQKFFVDLDAGKRDLLKRQSSLPKLSATSLKDWAKFVADFEDFEARAGHIITYVYASSSVDTENEEFPKEIARLTEWAAESEQIKLALEQRLGDASDADFAALLQEPAVAGLEYYLRKKREQAKQRMPAELENLQTEISVNSEMAWSQLYSVITGKLKFELAVPGKPVQTLSFSQKNSLIGHPDPAVRRAALKGSNDAIKTYEDVFASILNALAGERNTLWKRRQQTGFLQSAMQGSAIQESTVEAMFAAIKAKLPRLREHLKTKAKVIGLEKLGFQDIACPLPASRAKGDALGWDEGVDIVLKAFASYPNLQNYTRHAVENGWIDAAPGAGRAPGGYCTGSDVIRQSRIYMTYQGSFGDVQTLAHEIGHAFHSYVLKEDRPLRGQYPMTLAETASTFAQTLLVKDVLASDTANDDLNAQILTEMTNDITSFCMDIMMRYEFEKRFYQKRAEGTLSAKDLCALMVDVQKEVFGDALDEGQLDPYFWASKMHFFMSGLSFYNFPYTFGYLLSRYLVQRRFEEGTGFYKTYEEFLKLTGAATCEDVCKKVLGEDVSTSAFWTKALDGCIEDLDLFAKRLS